MAQGRGGVEAELELNLSASCSVGMNVLSSRKKTKNKKKPTHKTKQKHLSIETWMAWLKPSLVLLPPQLPEVSVCVRPWDVLH